MRNMKIAMFGHKRIPSREGGVEIVVEELALRLVELGNQVVCYNRRRKQYDREYDFNGIKIKSVPTLDRKGLAAVSSSFFAAILSAIGDYDIVHIHAEGPAFFAWIPKLFNKKIIVTIHGLDWQREKWRGRFGSWFIQKGEVNAVKYADEIIVLSENMKEYFKKKYNRNTHFIPNGVNLPEVRKADQIEQLYSIKKDGYILFLGRLVPEKGISYLIDSFLEVNTNMKLVIAGGSSDTPEYEREIKNKAKKDSRIIFTGFVQGSLLEELYSNAYLYVLPSDLEGMPLSLLEAMSYGNCCLVSDIKELTEVVEDKGVIFSKGDITALTNKLQNLCDHPEVVKKYKKDVENFICEKYNWNSITNKTLELYEQTRKPALKN